MSLVGVEVEVDVGQIIVFETEWGGTNCEWSKIIWNRTLRWDWTTDFTILKLLLATKTQTSSNRFTTIRLVKHEDFCGAIALTYFVENCLDLT